MNTVDSLSQRRRLEQMSNPIILDQSKENLEKQQKTPDPETRDSYVDVFPGSLDSPS